MILQQRERFHQLHPVKLLTDWGTAALAGYLLWLRQPLAAVVVGFVPSILVTAVFLSGRLDRGLERIASRPVAQAVAQNLSAGINTLRFAGLAISWAGCWFQQAWWIPTGVLVIAGAWWFAWRRGVAQA